MDSPEQFRLFVAVSVPADVKTAIEKAQNELRQAISSQAARWTRPEQFHLTLRFLGNVGANRVQALTESLKAACELFSPLQLTSVSLDFFPNARFPRVLWVGVTDQQGALVRLWKAVQLATDGFTEQRPEQSFVGHLTLARLSRVRRSEAQALAKAAEKFQSSVFGLWTATQLDLMRSELSPQGACHSLLAALPLLAK